MSVSFYTEAELEEIGLKSYGTNVKISRFVRLYNPQNISIGNNVRIDDYCVLSAGSEIIINNYVHIGCFTSLIGRGRIELSNFSGLSGHVSIYSSNDDYSGNFMTNPMVESCYTNVTDAPVFLGEHVIIGAGSVILPGVTIEAGAAIGAMSLVNTNCKGDYIYAGNPLKRLLPRATRYKKMENNFLNNM